jgi:AraC family transcriptional regulator, exoenzyme S synthesis regulatory protein ExsA
MPTENIPEIYINNSNTTPDLYVYDFKMTNDVVKSKVHLSMNMFSFLQVGKKQVHFAGTTIAVNKDQSLLLKKGIIRYRYRLLLQAIFLFRKNTQ